MVSDHLCCPGLDRPVSISEYATLKGVKEAEVFAGIRALKIPSAFFRGQWYVEAPPNTEARLAQLRTDKAREEGGLADWVAVVNQSRARVRPPAPEQQGLRLSELPRRDPISQPKPVPAPVPQPVSNTQEDIGRESEVERLRARIQREIPAYESLTGSEKKALLKMTEYAPLPQPVNYGLTYHETFHALWVGGEKKFRDETPEDEFRSFKYKAGNSVSFWSGWALAIWLLLYLLGFAVYAALNPNIPAGGVWTWDNPHAIWGFFLLMALPGFFPGFPITAAIVQGVRESYKRRHPSAGLLAFRQALRLHKLYATARSEADAVARAAAHEAELRKRSYWEFLDGYQFERATAEVLRKHQFTAMVTPGSADGGIDIEVTRNGLKGVVQCKAHVACVGPHVVRDLYGVIHHCGADFGIIVSRGGFTRGAHDFRRDKPILFVDTDDLIAMQEGRDVLAAAFATSSSDKKS